MKKLLFAGMVIAGAFAFAESETLISDLSKAAVGTEWRPMPYETRDGIKGTMLYAAYGMKPRQQVKIKLPVQGRHRILLGLGGTRYSLGEAQFNALVRLERDPAPIYLNAPASSLDAGWWFQPVEVEWKTVDLDDDVLIVENPRLSRSVIAWVRLIPVTERPSALEKRHVVTNDAYKPVNSFDEVCAPIMRFANSCVRSIYYCVGTGAFTSLVPSKVATQGWAGPDAHADDQYSRECDRGYMKLQKEHPNMLNEMADFAHKVGLEFHVSFRTGCALDCIYRDSPRNRFDSPARTAAPFRPEDHCRLWDGTPVPRYSYASEDVQEFFLRFYAEMLTEKVDGINLIWIRALPAMLFEQAFRDRFRKAYGEELKSETDPRIVPLRKEIMTGFLRKVRQLAGKKHVSIVVPAKGAVCESFGLDVARLAKEGIVDEIDVGDCLQTPQHSESYDYIEFDYFRQALAGTKAIFLPFLWNINAEKARSGMAKGAAGAFLWDGGEKSWEGWLHLNHGPNEKYIRPTVRPLKTLDGFDITVYPWHVAY